MQNIQEIRKQTNMSQSKFADFTGIPTSTLRHWEQNYSTPPQYVIVMLKSFLREKGFNIK